MEYKSIEGKQYNRSNQETRCIDDFVEGTVLVRIKAAKYDKLIYNPCDNTTEKLTSILDDRYIQEPLKFLKRVNNTIYAECMQDKTDCYKKGDKITLDYDKFRDGWIEYVNNTKSTENPTRNPSKSNLITKNVLKIYKGKNRLKNEN